MFDILSIEYETWSQHTNAPGAHNTRQRTAIVNHHPYPHAVKAGAGLSVEIRELRAIDAYHRQQGWAGIGYHFVVSQSGRIFVARGWHRSGAHAPGYNSTSYGLAWLLNGFNEEPSAAAKEAARALIAESLALGYLSSDYRVLMHGDVVATNCPGTLLRSALGEWEWPRQTSAPETAARRRILKVGMSGEDVRQLQRALAMAPNHQTGFFGPITQARVRDYQRAENLVVDGIVGPQVYGRLYGE